MHCLRRHKRISLRDFFQVIDKTNKLFLGYISNVSVEGLRVISTTPLALEKCVLLGFKMPNKIDQNGLFQAEANLVWSSSGVIPGFCDSGFSFHAVSSINRKLIYELIALYGLDESWSFNSAKPQLN